MHSQHNSPTSPSKKGKEKPQDFKEICCLFIADYLALFLVSHEYQSTSCTIKVMSVKIFEIMIPKEGYEIVFELIFVICFTGLQTSVWPHPLFSLQSPSSLRGEEFPMKLKMKRLMIRKAVCVVGQEHRIRSEKNPYLKFQ